MSLPDRKQALTKALQDPEELVRAAASRALDRVEGLERLALRHPGLVREVRGPGLLQAMDLTVAGGPIVESCMRQGLLINCTANTVLRFLPPLIVTTAEVDEMLETLERALASTSVEGGDIS